MTRTKQKHIPSAHEKKKRKNQGAPKVDLAIESEWMVVKKQRITILIPPLPIKVQSTMPNVQEKPEKANSHSPRKTSSRSQGSLGIYVSKQPVLETEKPMSLSPEKAIPFSHTEIEHPFEPNLMSQKPSSFSHRNAPDNSLLHSFRDGKGIGTCSSSRMSKGLMLFADSNTMLDRRMRASYLDMKLKKAGGLENWLFSLGLSCFVKVFQKKRVNKFQLANLTMRKLRDMGAYAVGPRRKLMHAIDCLCEPHCFQNL